MNLRRPKLREELQPRQIPPELIAVVKLSELRWGRMCAVLKLGQISTQSGLRYVCDQS